MGIANSKAVLDSIMNNKELRSSDRKLIVDWLKEEKLNPSNPVSIIRLEKLKNMIESATSWFDVPATEITEKEYRQVLEDLRNNKIRGQRINQKVMDYAEETKTDYVAMHKSFLKWIWWKGINKRIKINGRMATFDQVFRNYKYIVTKEARQSRPEPPIYTKEEIKKIAKELPPKYAIVLYVGYDTGARPKEICGMTASNIKWDSDKKKYWAFIDNPKLSSVKRNVDCAVFNNEISDCLAKLKLKPEDRILPSTVVYITKIARKACDKLKIKKQEPFKVYDLRHSSIQYYTDVYNGNIPTLAIRYGWTIQSAPRRLQGYLARSQIHLPDASLMANKDKIGELKSQIDIQERQIQNLLDKKETSDKKMNMIEKKVEALNELGSTQEKMLKIKEKQKALQLADFLVTLLEQGKVDDPATKKLLKEFQSLPKIKDM
jgi:integrase